MTDYITPLLQDLISTALYVDFTDGILLCIVCLSLIFAIQDYRIGLMALFLMTATAYIFFTLTGLAVSHVTILFLFSLLLMAFSFFVTKKPGGAMFG